MKKTVIVTGASRGIGFAISRKYASEGWNIAFCSKNKLSVDHAKTLIRNDYSDIKVLAMVCDMSRKEEVVQFGRTCLEEFSSIDILVNNAGIYIPGNIASADFQDDLEELMKVNLYSAYWLGKVIIPNMVGKGSGHIFNISSIAGLEAYPNGGSYAVTKFALTGYTRTIRQELKGSGVKVTGVFPGATYTDSWASSDLPESRFMKSEDIAEMIYATSQLSKSAVVEDIVLRPQLGDI